MSLKYKRHKKQKMRKKQLLLLSETTSSPELQQMSEKFGIKPAKSKKEKIKDLPAELTRKIKKRISERVLPLSRYVTALTNIEDIEDGVYVKTKTGYFSVLKIYGIDIFNYKPADKSSAYINFAQAETRLSLPHKFIFMDGSPSMSEQITHVQHKLEKTEHYYRKFVLERQLNRFNIIEKEQRDRLAYLMIFGPTKDELSKATQSFIHEMKDTSIEYVSGDTLELMLSNYLKFHSDVSLNYDENLLREIMPKGVEFKSTHIKVGDKYVTSLTAYKFPAYISDLLLADLFAMGDVRATMDVSFKLKETVKTEIKSSMDELQSRAVVEKSSAETVSNIYEYRDLEELYVAIDRGNEQIVSTTIRFWLSSETLEGLNILTDYVKKTLQDNGIDSTIRENEMGIEFFSLTSHSDVIGQAIPLYETLSKQYPFYYQSLIDSRGMYCGQTSTYGQVIVDTFRIDKDNGRESFDILIVGLKGSGKSVTLKAMCQDIVSLGHKCFALDVDREYAVLASALGGKVIRFGTTSRINPLQLRVMIVAQAEEEDTNNFAVEIARIETFMYQYIPELTAFEAEEFKILLMQCYKDKGIDENTDISILRPEEFPIFTDVLQKLRSKLYTSYINEDSNEFNTKLTDRKRNDLEKLETYIKGLAEGIYSSIFNGYSNIDIANETFVIFDVKDIAEMGDKVYNSLLFNILSLTWNEICNNRTLNLSITNELDRNYVVSLIDEAHRFINARNPHALDYIEKLTRRSRKYDAGLWFASQSILDFMPSVAAENSDKIITIFNLVQYKMIMKQSDSSHEMLLKVFPQFTESEITQTSNFKPGETLMSYGGERQKIRFRRHIATDDLAVFGGGRERMGALTEYLEDEEEQENEIKVVV